MRLRNRAGFTLIEMIIVISIVTMLIGGSALGYGRYQQNARDARRKTDLEQIRAALELFRSNTVNGNYPTSWYAPGWQNSISPYFGNSVSNIPKDPSTKVDYVYYSVPTWCSGSACTSYALRATLELGGTCIVDPNKSASSC